MSCYLNHNNLLFHKQFGFREGHSTDHATIELKNGIYNPSIKPNIR